MGKLAGIADKLNIDDILPEDIEIEVEDFDFNDDHNLDIEADYIFMRKKLRKSVAVCEKILKEALRGLSLNPTDSKTIDATANTIKTMSIVTKELQEMHQKYKNMKKDTDRNKNDNDDEGTEKSKIKKTLNEIIDEINKSEG